MRIFIKLIVVWCLAVATISDSLAQSAPVRWSGSIKEVNWTSFSCLKPVRDDRLNCRQDGLGGQQGPANIHFKVLWNDEASVSGLEGPFPSTIPCSEQPQNSHKDLAGLFALQTFLRCKVLYRPDFFEIVATGEIYFEAGQISKLELYGMFYFDRPDCDITIQVEDVQRVKFYAGKGRCERQN